MWGMTARQNRRMAESLVMVISCQSASEAAIRPPAHARPALLTIISTLPKRSTTDATTRSGSPESPTSASTRSTSTPNWLPMPLAVLERRSAPRATRTRFTPLSANSLAIARPIPALAPVTMAVFPAMPKFMSCSLHQIVKWPAIGPLKVGGIVEVLIYFLFQTPHDSERVATFAGADESALFHRLDGVAIGRQRAYLFIIFQPPQNWVTAERISFKLVSVLDVRKQLLFNLCEFRQQISSCFLRHFSPPFAGSLVPRSR